ncbi:GRB2-related adapter protein 2b isoform X2 [Sebastes umbrosus]|uniref:GRB2-related adapter protein 2b isoform X2 n=1 Tax=Sebastes umbrosus TaxID=72105 RepID=UPI00189EBEA8|nr:GRB2-related adapter protein 2b isoform X2 [Sebastes umbrosus]
MEATAKFDYKAEAGDDLSFGKGEQLKILQTSGNWYKAELNGCEGFVPKNFITIHLPSWYEEDSSRSDAQEKLLQQPTGAFIIRGSQNSAQGRFAISVRQEADVQHFKVLRDSRGQYYLWSEKFPSLNQMVEYYKNNSISKHSQVFLQEMKQQPVGDLLTGPNRRGPLPAPPLSSSPPTPEPRTRQVRALYCFNAEETDELQFNAGDVITVLENSDEAWWRGQLRGKTGLFPSNFTKPI